MRSQEVDGGDQMIGMGRSILAALLVLVDLDASDNEKLVEKKRLRQLNPDKDGLSSLAKTGRRSPHL